MDSMLRGLAMYLFLLMVFRVAGKRSLARASSFDLILLLMIGGLVKDALVNGDESLTNAMLLVLTLVGADALLSRLKRRHRGLAAWLEGLPVVLVREGKPVEPLMEASRVDRQDVLAAAREQGLQGLEQVRYAVLENTGKISIIPRS
jgi:uncharacterized membrane protein YcaP (DUF421 family)